MKLSWLGATIIATFFFGVYPIFGNKAGQIHGERINFIIDTTGMITLSIVLAVKYRGDFSRITANSLFYAVFLYLSSIAFLAMLYAWRVAPEKLSVIMITIGFASVITAVINHFLGDRLMFHQWVGAIIAFLGVALVNWKR